MTDDPVQYFDAVATADETVVAAALGRHGFTAPTWKLINLSENATYLVEDAGTGFTGVLRVHRPDYHTHRAISSELDWLADLGARTPVSTPVVIPDSGGERVSTVDVRGLDRHAVLFELLPGAAPDETALRADDFETLGSITALMHRHARGWRRPAGFERFAWDWHHSLGGAPRWGHWRDGIGVGPAEHALLGTRPSSSAPGSPSTATAPTGTASSTPTCGRPTCSSTAARST